MSSKKDIQNRVVGWAKEVGIRVAQARLVIEGASPNTAQKLTAGKYHHKLSPLMEAAVLRAMAGSKPKEEAS